MTSAFTAYLIYVLVIYILAAIVSYCIGKWQSLLTYSLITVFQSILSIGLSPVAVAQFGNRVSVNPEINVGMVVAILLIIFAKPELKKGAICYLGAILAIAMPVIFCLI